MAGWIRSRLTYANVVSTLALCIAVSGGTVYAATHLSRNSVTSRTIKNGQVRTPDIGTGVVTSSKLRDRAVTARKIAPGAVTAAALANNSVLTNAIGNNAITNGKLADGSISTGKIGDAAVTGPKIAADSVTGANVAENSLQFGCTKNGGEFQLPGGGFCAVRLAISNKTWYQAVLQCAEDYPSGTLPTMAQVQALASTSATTMFNGPMAVWTGETSGAGPDAWIVGVATTSVNTAGSFALTTNNQNSDIICVYDPASKNG